MKTTNSRNVLSGLKTSASKASTILSRIAALAFGAVVLFHSSNALACSCLPQTIEEAARIHDLIFRGEVTSIQKNPMDEFHDTKVTLKIARTWKGQATGQVHVFTAPDSAMCGYEFTSGQEYLVFATTDNQTGPQVSLCSRTALAKNAKEDQAFLDRKFPRGK